MTTINRNPLPVNDSGSCTDGTPITREWWIAHLDAIDAALAAIIPLTFPAVQVPSTNPNALDDYEEGTFAPIDVSGAGLAFVNATGSYVKIGQLLISCFNVVFPGNANATPVAIGGLPYVSQPAAPYWGATINYTTCGLQITVLNLIGEARVIIFTNGGGPIVNSQMSGHEFRCTVVYRAAT